MKAVLLGVVFVVLIVVFYFANTFLLSPEKTLIPEKPSIPTLIKSISSSIVRSTRTKGNNPLKTEWGFYSSSEHKQLVMNIYKQTLNGSQPVYNLQGFIQSSLDSGVPINDFVYGLLETPELQKKGNIAKYIISLLPSSSKLIDVLNDTFKPQSNILMTKEPLTTTWSTLSAQKIVMDMYNTLANGFISFDSFQANINVNNSNGLTNYSDWAMGFIIYTSSDTITPLQNTWQLAEFLIANLPTSSTLLTHLTFYPTPAPTQPVSGSLSLSMYTPLGNYSSQNAMDIAKGILESASQMTLVSLIGNISTQFQNNSITSTDIGLQLASNPKINFAGWIKQFVMKNIPKNNTPLINALNKIPSPDPKTNPLYTVYGNWSSLLGKTSVTSVLNGNTGYPLSLEQKQMNIRGWNTLPNTTFTTMDYLYNPSLSANQTTTYSDWAIGLLLNTNTKDATALAQYVCNNITDQDLLNELITTFGVTPTEPPITENPLSVSWGDYSSEVAQNYFNNNYFGQDISFADTQNMISETIENGTANYNDWAISLRIQWGINQKLYTSDELSQLVYQITSELPSSSSLIDVLQQILNK